jgi:hypothetical protein
MAPTKSPRLRLLHIRDEIDDLTAALADVSFEAYCDSYTLRRATERALQIICPLSCGINLPKFPGTQSLALAMCCGTTTNISTTVGFGTS